jgi:osmotically-inducible protein OsmY
VDNFYEKRTAEQIVLTTYGVKKVVNSLNTKTDAIPYVYEYGSNYYFPYTYDSYTYAPFKSDTVIEDDIRNQIIYSPYVDVEDVNISVDNGVATLSGNVDSWIEYYRAEANAFDGGAISVDNNLVVQYYN